MVKKVWSRKYFIHDNSRNLPLLPHGYQPYKCTDAELYELLKQIDVTPQKEVASLQEWNHSMDLESLYRGNYNLREHLLCDNIALARLKTNKQVSCLMINPGQKFYPPIQTAIRWALHLKLPVVTVPGLRNIMKDRIGVEAILVCIRKNPQIDLFKSILKRVKEVTLANPVVLEQAKMKPQKKNVPSIPKPKVTTESVPKDKPNVEHDGVAYTKFRPLVKANDAAQINKLLMLLPYLHVGKSSRWNITDTQTYPEIRTQLILDRTPVCVLIKRKFAGCVLIAAKQNEKLNLKKLIHICLLENVPVLIVPGLDQTMQAATAISANVVGIFKYATDPLLEKILNLVKFLATRRYACPPQIKPKGLIDYGDSNDQVNTKQEVPVVKQNTEDIEMSIENESKVAEKTDSVDNCTEAEMGDGTENNMNVTEENENAEGQDCAEASAEEVPQAEESSNSNKDVLEETRKV